MGKNGHGTLSFPLWSVGYLGEIAEKYLKKFKGNYYS